MEVARIVNEGLDYVVAGVPAAGAALYAAISPPPVGTGTPSVVITGIVCSAVVAIFKYYFWSLHEERVTIGPQLRADAAKVPGLSADLARATAEVEVLRKRVNVVVSQPKPGEIRGGKYSTVLYVEDNEAMAASAARYLGDANFEVLAAATLREAKAIFDDTHVDAIVSDLTLPDGDGEFLVERASKSGRGCKIVVTTGTTDEDRKQRVRAMGAFVMTKPVDLDVLVDHIRPDGTGPDMPVIRG
jgi:CheY-like chemotaxis protein